MGGGNKSKPEETAVEAVDRSRGDPMIETVVIYFIFLIHWLELTFGTAMSTGIKGVSLGNLSVALAVLGWLLSIAFKRANFQWSNMYYFILLLVWVVAMSIPYKALHGDFRHVSMLREIVTFKNWVQPYLLLVLVFNLAHSKTIAKRITVGLMIYVMLSVLVTILVVTDTFLIGAIQIERGGHWPRFSGPNTYAAFLVLMSPLFFSHVLLSKLVSIRIATAGCFLLILFALIASGSRGGFLSFVVAVIAYLWLLKGLGKTSKRGLIAGFAVISLMVVITIAIMPSKITDRTSSRIEYEEGADLDKYSSSRIRIWTLAWPYFMKRPFFGMGHDGYKTIATEYNLAGDTHNIYLGYLVDHGIIGLGLYGLLLIGLLNGGLKGLNNARDDFGIILCLSFFCGMLGLMIATFFFEYLPTVVHSHDLWRFDITLCSTRCPGAPCNRARGH
jgi:O-antigen ligase